MLNEREQVDHKAWEEYRLTYSGCLEYLDKFPAGKHVEEAEVQRDFFIKEKERDEEALQKQLQETQKFLDDLKSNPNICTPQMIIQLFKDKTITKDDLYNYNIPWDIINELENVKQEELELGETPTPDEIPGGYTEVYFWGVPGSGKTCVLSAVLSTARRKSYLEIKQGKGYHYTDRLSTFFSDEKAILPPRTPVDKTQYMPFVLNVGIDKPRSVSLIEVSGEIFECFYHKNAHRPFPSRQHTDTFNSIMNFLNSKNRKIHFFFVDYELATRKDIFGITQGGYLSAAATFFDENDIFGETTNGIYVVLTKSDLMNCNKKERITKVKGYLENKFPSFVQSLKTKCRKHSINAGYLLGMPFSLGKVYFQQICNFEDDTAEKIVNVLISRIRPRRRSILNKLNN